MKANINSKRLQKIAKSWVAHDDGNISTARLLHMVSDDCKISIQSVIDALYIIGNKKGLSLKERIDDGINNFGSIGDFKISGILVDCKAEIERLESKIAKAKEYVPMTSDELIWEAQKGGVGSVYGLRSLQNAIIKRAGLVVKESA